MGKGRIGARRDVGSKSDAIGIRVRSVSLIRIDTYRASGAENMIASSPLSRWVSIGEDETGINATLGDSRDFSTFAAFALVPARLVFAVLCLVALRLARTPLTKISPPSCELNCPRFLPFPLFGSWTRQGRKVEAGERT